MPLYTFKCKQGHTFDKIVAYDTTAVRCPTCVEENDTWAKTPGQKVGSRKQELAKRVGVEVPARRNPAYGLQR